jgi:hydroxymethylbilane synthase
MTHALRLGTRGSELALWQARRVASLIDERLGLECSIEIVRTQGDRIQNVAFHKMEGKGFFTKELQEAMLSGQVDLVVHSLKDLPTDEPDGLEIGAIPERHQPADMLLVAPGRGLRDTGSERLPLAPGTVVGTSSLRRAAQVLALEPRVRIKALRGNVPTRVDKLRRGDYDAIVIAAAGIQRLGLDLDELEHRILPPALMLPAPGQGALAIEIRKDDPRARCLEQLHDPAIATCVAAERGLLELVGGGCHVPLGCLATQGDDQIVLRAVLGSIDEQITRAGVIHASARAATPHEAARLCHAQLTARREEFPEVEQ